MLATKEEDAKLESHIEAQQLKEIKEKKAQQVAPVATTNSNEKSTTFTFQKRPKRLYGFTEKIGFTYGDKYGKAYVTVNLNDGEPWEVFISTKVKEASSLAKALGLMTTKLLRLGAADNNLEQVIDTLSYDQTMGTLPVGLANILRSLEKEPIAIVPVKLNSDEAAKMVEVSDSLKKVVKQFNQNAKAESQFRVCPDCGEQAFDKANCICNACGSSKCN